MYKLSQWHDGSVKPVHDGVYQRKFPSDFRYSKFYKGHWHWYGDTIIEADRSKMKSEHFVPWRGIVK